MRVLQITASHILPGPGAEIYGADTCEPCSTRRSLWPSRPSSSSRPAISPRTARRAPIGDYARSCSRRACRATSSPGTTIREPYGYVEAAELRRLEAALTEDPKRPTIVCLHHSPTRPWPSSGCHLRNDDELSEVLDAHARAVPAGHSHMQLERRIRHAVLLTSPATSSQCVHAQLGASVDHEDFWRSHEFDASRHGFRMLTLHADGRLETDVHWVRNAG